MSKKHPECPLYNPLNCKDYNNPMVCAFVRKDKVYLKEKKIPQNDKLKKNIEGGEQGVVLFRPIQFCP